MIDLQDTPLVEIQSILAGRAECEVFCPCERFLPEESTTEDCQYKLDTETARTESY